MPKQGVKTADETHAEFHKAKRRPSLMRREGKLLVGLAVLLCGAGFLVYRALVVLPPPPPPVATHSPTGPLPRP